LCTPVLSDNPTTRCWFDELPGDRREDIWNYLKRQGAKSTNAAAALMELAWSSVASLAIAPLQDLLNLGNEARMNVSGSTEGNWRWRATEGMLSDTRFERLRELTRDASRSSVLIVQNEKTEEPASRSKGG